MLVTHGYAKIFGVTLDGTDVMTGFVAKVTGMGFPAPEAFAWAAALSELIGGSLMVIGLFTRPAAFLALCTMLGAVYSHRADGFSHMEKPMLFGVIFIALLLGGAGRFSFDAIKQARKERAALSIFR